MPSMFYSMNMKNIEMPSQSNAQPLAAHMEVGESRIFIRTLVSQLNDDPILSTYRLNSYFKVGIFYMKPDLLTARRISW